MAHIHELVDFTVSAFIIHEDKVLLIHHKKLDKWLQIGGHIELDETPDQALFREIKEECGLEVEVMCDKPSAKHDSGEYLYTPNYVDVHNISETHNHIGMVYFLKALTTEVKLAELEHHGIKWATIEEAREPALKVPENVLYFIEKAFDTYNDWESKN